MMTSVINFADKIQKTVSAATSAPEEDESPSESNTALLTIIQGEKNIHSYILLILPIHCLIILAMLSVHTMSCIACF